MQHHEPDWKKLEKDSTKCFTCEEKDKQKIRDTIENEAQRKEKYYFSSFKWMLINNDPQ